MSKKKNKSKNLLSTTSSGKQNDELVENISSLEELYEHITLERAHLLLVASNWFMRICKFDPSSGLSVPSSLDDVLDRINLLSQEHNESIFLLDRLTRIVDHVHEAINKILKSPRDKILREHVMLPVYAAREIDSKTIQWLSLKSGRNLREKLSGKPYIKAVKRQMSIDTIENRLLKALMLKLDDMLDARYKVYDKEEDTILNMRLSTKRWLRQEGENVSRWDNIPPNNTLLQDKNYRKIWDSWVWAQNMDTTIQTDWIKVPEIAASFTYWSIISKLSKSAELRFVQQPFLFVDSIFELKPFVSLQAIIVSKEHKLLKNNNNLNAVSEMISFLKIERGFKINFSGRSINVRFKSTKIDTKIIDNNNSYDYKYENLKTIVDDVVDHLIGKSVNRKKKDLSVIGCNRVVVDLTSVRPDYVTDNQKEEQLPFNLIYQLWQDGERSSLLIDCGDSCAIKFANKINTISILDAFKNNVINKAIVNSAIMYFCKKLISLFNTDELIYLMPDAIHEFVLQPLRKAVNFHFHNSTPLPKSIAAVFSLQASQKLKYQFKDNDIVVAIEDIGNIISITPIVAKFSNELKKKLPESNGICWDRHPTVVIDNKLSVENSIKILKEIGCGDAEFLLDLFAFDGLCKNEGNLSFVTKDEMFFDIPNGIKKLLHDNLQSNTDLFKYIKKCLSFIKSKSNVFILPLSSSIKKPMNKNNYTWLDSSSSIIEGGQLLSCWQKKAKEISLWHDHLPELSIKILTNGFHELFYLVKNAMVSPLRGKKISIPITDRFQLPKGRPYYRFNLSIGEGSQKLKYVASLKSSAFPLQTDISCKLDMTYTYAADDPYELRFIPLDIDKAGFKSVQVQWLPWDMSFVEDAPIPGFPSPLSWHELIQYKNEKGGNSDLLDWVQRELDKIKDIVNHGRIVDATVTEKKDYHADNKYCMAGDVILRKSMFDSKHSELPEIGELVSFFKVVNTRGNFAGLDITINNDEPRRCFLQKSLRFPVINIWSNGHSINDKKVPQEFKNDVKIGIINALAIINSIDYPKSLKEEMLYFLSCLHKDAPKELGVILIAHTSNDITFKKYFKNIAFAMGALELPWQKTLFKNTISLVENKKEKVFSLGLKVLSIAIWREKSFVDNLDLNSLEVIIQKLYTSIKIKIAGNNYFEMNRWQKGIGFTLSFIMRLELLLALFRTRGFDNEEIKTLLSPEKEIVENFTSLLEDVIKISIQKKVELKSRIKLQVNKPKKFETTPDLLFALRLYLTGDTGANSIEVTSVSDSD